MFYSTISVADVEKLEEVFASFTPEGWVIPQWVIRLRAYVLTR